MDVKQGSQNAQDEDTSCENLWVGADTRVKVQAIGVGELKWIFGHLFWAEVKSRVLLCHLLLHVDVHEYDIDNWIDNVTSEEGISSRLFLDHEHCDEGDSSDNIDCSSWPNEFLHSLHTTEDSKDPNNVGSNFNWEAAAAPHSFVFGHSVFIQIIIINKRSN